MTDTPNMQVTDHASNCAAWDMQASELHPCNCGVAPGYHRDGTRIAALHAQPQAERDAQYFSASEEAAYLYPGEDQAALRDAFCHGAGYPAERMDDAVAAGARALCRDPAATAHNLKGALKGLLNVYDELRGHPAPSAPAQWDVVMVLADALKLANQELVIAGINLPVLRQKLIDDALVLAAFPPEATPGRNRWSR